MPSKDNLPARVADDSSHDSERGAGPLEHRPLLDVHLEVAAGKRPALDEGPTTRAPTLLVPEHDHAERSPAGPCARDRLEPADDAERPVELPAGRDTVEVRAGPDLGQLRL